jgi:hypothetical protein
MKSICEHKFERPNPKKPDYSRHSHDLAAMTELSIRKNLRTGNFEIFNTRTCQVFWDVPSLAAAVKIANEIEQEENTAAKCGPSCPGKTCGA